MCLNPFKVAREGTEAQRAMVNRVEVKKVLLPRYTYVLVDWGVVVVLMGCDNN